MTKEDIPKFVESIVRDIVDCEECDGRKENIEKHLRIVLNHEVLFLIDIIRQETIREFLQGKRCHTCGREKTPDPLCDTCLKCLEE